MVPSAAPSAPTSALVLPPPGTGAAEASCAENSAQERSISFSDSIGLEQAGDDAVFIYIDALGGGGLRQTGHRHDVARERDDEACARADLQIAHRDAVVPRRAALGSVIGEGVLRFGNADGKVPEPESLKLGAPQDFTVNVRNLKVSAGAGFIVALTGDIMTMPGLPKVPAAERIDVDSDGKISGLF
jgi:hypothetical protein